MYNEAMNPKLTIDGNKFSDFAGLVREFNPVVFGDDRTWSGSFDQLDDCLIGGFGAPEGEFTIEWINSHKSQKDLGKEATLAWLEEAKDNVHPTNRERWAMRIELMKHNAGDTLFLKMVNTIVRHPRITLILA
jgi:hypothetical protein